MILYGFAGISGRPLTMHEARLPQTSREMLAKHEWLLPTSGGRPWLERPPLPHWLVISAMKLFGHDDRVWIVRLPSAIMGTATVLLTLYIARRWFDPTVGVVAAFLLATSFKFYQYACLAEDDIFLAALVALAAALFTHAELTATGDRQLKWLDFLTNRCWPIWGFFAVLGLSNLTKGPLLGILVLGAPVAVYSCCRALITRSVQPLLRYTWLWGWLLLIALTLAWPLWAQHKYPDVIDNWKYDYIGRVSGTYSAINEPWWYYPPKLLVGLLPWTPVCLFGLFLAVVALKNASKSSRSLWFLCWSLVPVILLSASKGKHEHYLVPFLAPYAILGADGLIRLVQRASALPDPFIARTIRYTFITTAAVMLIGYCFGAVMLAARTDHTVDDTAFLLRARNEVPATAPLYIDGKLGPPGNLDFFRIQFYSRPDAVLLHNLSFLRDQSIVSPIVYVIARQADARLLDQLGAVEQIDQSAKSHDDDRPAGRFTLFRLTFNPHLMRYPAPAYVTSLQAMERAPGPWCGPALQ